MFSKFRLNKNEEFGRFLVSEETFHKGDMLWEESPLMSAPRQLDKKALGCVSCCKILVDDEMICPCPQCGWPCCSVLCSKSVKHREFECKLFTNLGTIVNNSNFEKLVFLRILLCQIIDPESYQKFLKLSHTFSDEDAESKNAFEICKNYVWNFLVSECHMTVPKAEISRILAAFKINSYGFQVEEAGSMYSAAVVYSQSSLVQHSCLPNLDYGFIKSESSDGDIIWNIRFYARKTIQPGDILTMAYNPCYLQYGTVPRQLKIFKSSCFICKCERCKDKTEGGTFFQALVCPECGRDKGYLLPMDPIETMISPWKCDNCDMLVDAHKVRKLVDKLTDIPYSLVTKVPADADSLKLARRFIRDQSGYLLHANHYLIFVCRMHWVLGCNIVNQGLIGTSKVVAQNLFVKIKNEFDVCLPYCLNFMPTAITSILYFVFAQTYAAYVFKSYDMINVDQGTHRYHKIWRVCKRIATLMEECMLWKRMKSSDLVNPSYSETLFSWSQRAEKFETEIRTGEDMALVSIRYLFSEI